jgi:crotonobetainyl-CoA:carnitine CoA-transferase CaiB-like acyl-CoA transferase
MSDGPLAGLTVVDAGVLFAAPLCATLLGDFGADVIKVEHPAGDPLRSFGWQKDGESVWWKVVSRNKRSVTLDLSTPDGQDAFAELAARSDVVLESFRPGTLERWGLGYDRIAKDNPGLILLRTSGYGQTGPYRDRPGFGTIAEAMSGFAAITGDPDGPPTLPSIALADGVAAVTGAMMVLMALHHRNAGDGVGQVIDLSLVEPLFWLLGPQATVLDELGIVQQRNGNRTPFSAPRNLYRTADDKWVAMSGSSANTARRVLELVGGQAMVDDPRFATNRDRVENADALDELIGGWVAQRTLGEVMPLFEAAQAATGPVYDIADIVEDAHFRAREALVRLDGVLMQNQIAKLSRTPGSVRTPAPAKGAHTAEVLRGLGVEPDRIERILAATGGRQPQADFAEGRRTAPAGG